MKDKMIEEMFNDIAEIMCDCEDKERFFRPHRYEYRKCYMHTVIQHIVFFLRNSDYCKLPEDSVVWTKNQIISLEHEWYKIGYEKASNETAEKIFEKIKNKINELEKFYFDNGKIGYNGLTIRELNKLAKQFGVEIKE